MTMMMMMIIIIIIIIYYFSKNSWKTAGTERCSGTNGKIRNTESHKVTHYKFSTKEKHQSREFHAQVEMKPEETGYIPGLICEIT